MSKRYRAPKQINDMACEASLSLNQVQLLNRDLVIMSEKLESAKKEAAAKENENRLLREELKQLESQSRGKLLELNLDLQHKSAKLETYESLKEERDHLIRCRDEAERKLRALETKYQGVVLEMTKLKIGEDMKLSNVKAALQLKTFELERANIALQECRQRCQSTTEEKGKLKEKVEKLNEDINDQKVELTAKITRLSLELESTSSKLEVYEGIENSLDEMVLKAAEVPDAHVGQDMLNFCTGATSLPTDSRRRLQQAYDLAKQNCELEKKVSDQRQEILELYEDRHMLRKDISDIKSMGGHSVSQLVEAVSAKNRTVERLNYLISSMELDFSDQKKKKEPLKHTLEGNEITTADQGASTRGENDAVSNAKPCEPQIITTCTVSLSHSPSNSWIASSAPASCADSTYTFPGTDSRLYLEPTRSVCGTGSGMLRNIGEERGEEPYDAVSPSAFNVRSSKIGPPTRVIGSRVSYKITAKPTSACSKKQSVTGSKVLPRRQVSEESSREELIREYSSIQRPNYAPLQKSKFKPPPFIPRKLYK